MSGVSRTISSIASPSSPFSPQNVMGQITGTGQNSGILGLGQYRTDPYRVDGSAFTPDANEQAYIAELQKAVAGQGPSVAEQQMRAGLDQANQQAQSFAASQRGVSPALAARLGAQQQAAMSQNANANAAMMRAQEQMNARSLLGQGLQSIRTGRMGGENLASGNYNYAQGLNLQGYANAAGHRADFFGGLLNSIGGGMSSMGGMTGASAGAGGGQVPDPSSFNHTPGIPQLATPLPSYNQGSDKKKEKPDDKKEPIKMGESKPQGINSHYDPYSSEQYRDNNHLNVGPFQRSQPVNYGDTATPWGWNNPYGSGNNFAVEPFSKAGQALNSPEKMAFGGRIRGMIGGMMGARGGGGVNAGGAGPMQVTPMPRGIAVKGPMPSQAQVAQPLMSKQPITFDNGGQVPGEAKVAGDSFKNDKVPALLSPKEIVLPRSVTLAEDAPARAAEFVAAVKARQSAKQRKAS